jgi:DNA-binding FrmR family transcriptional regulator
MGHPTRADQVRDAAISKARAASVREQSDVARLRVPEYGFAMHTIRERDKLIARVRRIRGQVEALEKAIANEEDCSKVLTTVAACRGALTALTAEIREDHIHFHVMDPVAKANSKRALAGEELIDVV